MNERDQDTRFGATTQQQLIQPITTGLSNIYESLHSVKENTDARITEMFRDIASTVGQARVEVMQQIEERLRKACQKQMETEMFTKAKIEGMLSSVSGMMGFIESALAKHEKRLEKLKRPGISGTADATLSERPGAKPQTSPVKDSPAQAPPGTVNVPGSFLNQFDIFLPPPTKNELGNLVISTSDKTSYLALVNLPDEMWNMNNSVGWYLSLTPTPLTRVDVPIEKDENGVVVNAGSLFVNVTENMPENELRSLMAQFPINQSTINYYSSQEAWNASTAIYSEPITRSVWEVFNLTPPAIQQAPPHLPSFRQLASNPLQMPQELRGSASGTPGMAEQLVDSAGQPVCPPPPCPEIQFTGITDALQGLLPSFSMPTKDQVCRALDPFYDWFGIPSDLRIPCTTIEQIWQYMNNRVPR